jgi:hypothetical protein
MAEGDGGYNPIGYHNGTIWPHDNSLIALGLVRYGYREEAAKVALAMLEATRAFGGRPPEAFAGYERLRTEFPVEYPTACSPQAWATGAPLALLRALLGLEPQGDQLRVAPHLPNAISQLELRRIPGRWGRVDARASAAIPIEDPSAFARLLDPPPASAVDAFERMPRRVRLPDDDLRGTIELVITSVGAWRVVMADGTASLLVGAGDAQATVEMPESTLLDLAHGEENATTAMLQGKLRVSGDISLLQSWARLVSEGVASGRAPTR